MMWAMVRFAIALALVLAAAPGGAAGDPRANSASSSGTTVPGTASQVPGTSAPGSASAASGVRSGHEPAVQDDYPRALAQARRSGLPLLVEVWAPW
jgi:hypothetical protein